MQMYSGGDRYDWIFLAMAFAQLDQRDRARKWYAEASNAPNRPNPEFDRFKAEADELFSERSEAENTERDPPTN